MEDKQQIRNILNNINRGDYSEAEKILSTVLECRIKDRIRECNAD